MIRMLLSRELIEFYSFLFPDSSRARWFLPTRHPSLDAPMFYLSPQLVSLLLMSIMSASAVLGLYGHWKLLKLFRAWADEFERRPMRRSIRSCAWAYFFFALFNVASVGTQLFSSSVPLQLARLLVLVSSGSCALCMSIAHLRFPNVMHACIFFGTLSFTIFGDSTRPRGGWPYAAEMICLGSALVSLVALAPRLHHWFGKGRNGKYNAIILSLTLVLVAVPIDNALCIKGLHGMVNGVHVVYIGLGLVFWTLLRYLLDQDALVHPNSAAESFRSSQSNKPHSRYDQ